MANRLFTSFRHDSPTPNPFGGTMKAKVLVPADRNTALEAIRALDALGAALSEYHNPPCPRRCAASTRMPATRPD